LQKNLKKFRDQDILNSLDMILIQKSETKLGREGIERMENFLFGIDRKKLGSTAFLSQ
jgi:hypothetical protein